MFSKIYSKNIFKLFFKITFKIKQSLIFENSFQKRMIKKRFRTTFSKIIKSFQTVFPRASGFMTRPPGPVLFEISQNHIIICMFS